MQPSSIGPGILRVLVNNAPDLLSDLFTPGRVIEADVVSVFQGRAILAMGRGVKVEVELQTPLQEGEKVKLQVQPRESQRNEGEQRAPFILKVVPAQTQAQRAGIVTPPEVGKPIVGKMLSDATGVSQVAVGKPPGAEEAPTAQQHQQIAWLPIPMPDGTQGWAQIRVQEEAAQKGRPRSGVGAHQIRLWWETPALGPVLVTLDALDEHLTALFTVESPQSRQQVESGLNLLLERLSASGFPAPRLGVRQPLPGENLGPARSDETGRFDRRA